MSDERRRWLERVLASMDPLDREVLVLRHFQHRSNADVAAAIGIDVLAASQHYIRAVETLWGSLEKEL